MIYIVAPNVPLAKSYVRKELGGDPDSREIHYVTTPETALGIILRVGDKVHKISTNEYPMSWQLYQAWEKVERQSGLPTLATPPFTE